MKDARTFIIMLLHQLVSGFSMDKSRVGPNVHNMQTSLYLIEK